MKVWMPSASLQLAVPNCAWPFSNLYLSRESRVSMPAVIHRPASHSHLGAVQSCWTALTVWTEQLQWAGCRAAALGFIMEVVKGWRTGEDGLLIHFPSRWSSSPKPPAVPCRLLLPYHNGMTNGAMKILEVQWSSVTITVVICAAHAAGEHSSAEQIMHYRWNSPASPQLFHYFISTGLKRC